MNAVPVILAFLIGSIPFGILFARTSGVDVRRSGSGNIGATNVGRTVGRRAGALTLACDLGKGVLAVALAKWMGIPQGWVATVCLAAVLGHVYSPWLCFRGGKGVATAAGAFLVAAPLATAISLVVFAAAVKLSRRISVGSILGVAVMPFSLYGAGASPQMTTAGAIVAALVIIRHRDNLKRLLAGSEPKLRS